MSLNLRNGQIYSPREDRARRGNRALCLCVQLPSKGKGGRKGVSGFPTLLSVSSLLQTMAHCKRGSFDVAEVP